MQEYAPNVKLMTLFIYKALEAVCMLQTVEDLSSALFYCPSSSYNHPSQLDAKNYLTNDAEVLYSK